MEYLHKSIMLNEVINCFSYLKNTNNAIFVDGTLGSAGHTIGIVHSTNSAKSNLSVIGIDKDQTALQIAELKIKNLKLSNIFTFIHEDFHNINKILENLNLNQVDGFLLDLGVSSMQLDDKSRGFSFEDPDKLLDMRMDRRQHKDAEYILNNYPEHLLEKVLREGEEKFYKKITKNIIDTRKKKQIKTIGELLEIIANAYPQKLKMRKRNIATDTFRALRIEVNDEICRLAQSIETMVDLLKPKGKLAIISFHSLEDRIVKQKMHELQNPCTCPPKQPFCTCGKVAKIKILTKKPIIPSDNEIVKNPRARSAKLRIAQRI